MIAANSPLAALGITAATPVIVAGAAYLFFAGHNQPGGGFAAGLVLGALVALRAVAGLTRPTDAVGLVSVGALISLAVAVAPLLVGRDLLDQIVVLREVPMLGTVKTGSAMPFDLGVTLIVVGLVVAVLEGMGAERLAPTGDSR